MTVPELAGTFVELETMADAEDADEALRVVRAMLMRLGINSGDLTTEQSPTRSWRHDKGRADQHETYANSRVGGFISKVAAWVSLMVAIERAGETVRPCR